MAQFRVGIGVGQRVERRPDLTVSLVVHTRPTERVDERFMLTAQAADARMVDRHFPALLVHRHSDEAREPGCPLFRVGAGVRAGPLIRHGGVGLVRGVAVGALAGRGVLFHLLHLLLLDLRVNVLVAAVERWAVAVEVASVVVAGGEPVRAAAGAVFRLEDLGGVFARETGWVKGALVEVGQGGGVLHGGWFSAGAGGGLVAGVAVAAAGRGLFGVVVLGEAVVLAGALDREHGRWRMRRQSASDGATAGHVGPARGVPVGLVVGDVLQGEQRKFVIFSLQKKIFLKTFNQNIFW